MVPGRALQGPDGGWLPSVGAPASASALLETGPSKFPSSDSAASTLLSADMVASALASAAVAASIEGGGGTPLERPPPPPLSHPWISAENATIAATTVPRRGARVHVVFELFLSVRILLLPRFE